MFNPRTVMPETEDSRTTLLILEEFKMENFSSINVLEVIAGGLVVMFIYLSIRTIKRLLLSKLNSTDDKDLRIAKAIFRCIAPDPVKHCNVYKKYGCAHVDGALCDVRTCDCGQDGDTPLGGKIVPIKEVK
jgi:hypothetical protein